MEDKITVIETRGGFLNFLKKHDKTLLIIFVILAFSAFTAKKWFFADTDVMWHYKAGEYLIKNRIIPHKDMFSWQLNLNWMAHEWLYEVFLYGIYSKLGINAAKIGLIIFLAIPPIISYFYNKKKIENPYLFLLFIMVLTSRSNRSACIRPSEVSIILWMIACMLMVSKNKYKNIYFFACCLLAVNLHGGSIASFIILPLFCVVSDFIVSYWKDDYKELLESVKENMYMLAAGFLGSLINPYGIFIYKYAYQPFGYAAEHILEWQPSAFDIFGGLVIIVVLISMGSSSMLRRLDNYDIRKYVVICAFMVKGMDVGRIYFNAVMAIMLCTYPCFEELLSITYKKLLDTKKLPLILVPLSVLTFFVTFTVLYLPDLLNNYSYLDYVRKEDKNTPLVDYIKNNGLENKKTFNPYGISGFLILNDVKVFIDARTDPYMEFFSDNDSLRDYFDSTEPEGMTAYEGWEKLNEKYKFEYAVFTKDNTKDRDLVDGLKNHNYELLFEDDNSAFFKIGE